MTECLHCFALAWAHLGWDSAFNLVYILLFTWKVKRMWRGV